MQRHRLEERCAPILANITTKDAVVDVDMGKLIKSLVRDGFAPFMDKTLYVSGFLIFPYGIFGLRPCVCLGMHATPKPVINLRRSKLSWHELLEFDNAARGFCAYSLFFCEICKIHLYCLQGNV